MSLLGSMLQRRAGTSVSILLGDAFHKRFEQPPDPEVLVDYLQRNFPGATYHAVYEAGYFGFWILRASVRLEVTCPL